MKMNAKQTIEGLQQFAMSSTSTVESLRSDGSIEDYHEKLTLDLECLEAIEKCALHQQVITDDVINASKLESHKVGLNFVNFSPYELVNGVVNLYATELSSKQIAMNLNIDIPSNFTVNSDPDRISQILMNLLTNAIKFTEKSSNKSINLSLCTLQTTPTHVVLQSTVEDTGPGLTEQEQQMLFQRFSQASVKTYHEYGGSGLGLYISKMLVELLGGRINVSSKKGQGTKFVFTMQCSHCVEIPQSPGTLEIDLGEAENTPYRILVVEDNPVNQKVLTRQLAMSGYVCDVASDGQEAVEKFLLGQSDLIFMDIEMPVMNGYEATRQIRAIESKNGTSIGIPIIGLSGNARSVHHQMALDAGMNDYMVKPYKKEALMDRIRHHLRKSA